MLLYPNAKINLGLHVMRRRDDGFHDIETVFYPVRELYDVLEIVPSDSLSMTCYGLKYDGDAMDDLCIKAYNALNMLCGGSLPPVSIYLHKRIPVGAGLGGGSSDAAFTIKGLNALFGLGLDSSTMKKAAAGTGSDCPFFIDNVPAFATGTGTDLEPFSSSAIESLSSDYEFRFVHPGVSVSTKEAYAGIVPRNLWEGPWNACDGESCDASMPHGHAADLRTLLSSPVEEWKGRLVNDFERSVFEKHPEIKAVKDRLYSEGAAYASMTGSGSTVFGIFRKRSFSL